MGFVMALQHSIMRSTDYFTRSATVSKASQDLPPLSGFSTTWGICFSLEAFPSALNVMGFATVLPRLMPGLEGIKCG